ncbi:MAG: glycosyltransferase family 2 protein, partial [Spirochaetota bacterium]
MLGEIIYSLLFVLMIFYFSINTVYLVILIMSITEIQRSKKYRFTFDLDQAFRFRLLPPVSIILPAYNEEKTIVESVRSILFVRYPEYELLVVNDGSKDGTLQTLIKAFNLIKTDYVFRRSIVTEEVRGIYISKEFKNIVVIDKENGGKADALNAGINVSRYPYFCAIDADTILGEDALAKLILPFVNDPERTTAVGGIVRPANGAVIQMGRLLEERLTKNLFVILQGVEYVRAFFLGRLGLAAMNSLLIISGAFGIFKKSDVLQVEGYKRKSLGEDMMLVVKLHKLKRKERKRYKVTFVTDTVCWTEIPSTVKVLSRQRIRWQMGLMESIFENSDMILNPKYGVIGLFSMPFYILTEIVPPFFELIGY